MNDTELEQLKEQMDKYRLGISFAVTTEEMKQSKDGKILEYMTEKYSRTLGEHIGKVKHWEMTPLAEDKMLIKRLEVIVFTPEEFIALIKQRETRLIIKELEHIRDLPSRVMYGSILHRIATLNQESEK